MSQIKTQKLYKDRIPFEKRKSECDRILLKYQDRVPVIVEKSSSTKIDIDKSKFLVPHDVTIGQFLYILRKRIKLNPDESIYLFINDIMPPSSALMSQIYGAHKDCDGFLYIRFSTESTFG